MAKYKERVTSYYLPVYKWVSKQLEAHRVASPAPGPPLVVGISAPQGCGKSTLCEQLVAAFEHEGMCAATVSIDDFYLTHDELEAVTARHAGNRLLTHRGNALTHDLDLGRATLSALRHATAAHARVELPRYDKSAFSGRGDRFPRAQWRVIEGAVDVVLFEGWMLGFRAVADEDRVVAVDKDLVPINQALQEYKAMWDAFVDAWLVVQVEDPAFAIAWRGEAERKQREAGRPAMTEEEVLRFMDCYLPAYKLYTPELYAQGPTTARPGHVLAVTVDRDRNPISIVER